ncbi:hypothetical protein Ccrd_020350 [Cynara cardunculus var. scolymus]|uniref:Uncharacterized protein n=1 Tax=Cynara cardunculus var. scolymus TaxID=59895 RepID=A0A118K0T5_CYNCS|nr:hypothetical protein Ccrd_020350 [Cynara cardunculus var. scolymus]
MLISTMPDLGNTVSMSSLTLSHTSTLDAENPFLMQDESNGRENCVKIKKSVESKSTDDYLGDWVAKNVELGIPESKLVVSFLVGAPKLVEFLYSVM